MYKVFKLEDLCCANCANKIQHSIAKLEGVNSVSVNFLTQKFSLDAEDALFDQAFAQAERIFANIEPDCTILR